MQKRKTNKKGFTSRLAGKGYTDIKERVADNIWHENGFGEREAASFSSDLPGLSPMTIKKDRKYFEVKNKKTEEVYLMSIGLNFDGLLGLGTEKEESMEPKVQTNSWEKLAYDHNSIRFK